MESISRLLMLILKLKSITENEDVMVNYRGFWRFKEFDQFLVKIYKERKKGQTVADLYPAILDWFETNQ